ETTTGLHKHDVRVLLSAFDELLQRGHTLVIIEHNLDVIKCADHVIDLGPEGGAEGGNLVFQGTPRDLCLCEQSYTAKYLKPKFNE
ncbi:MAG: excinuclease ABC subunit A, partial [Bacteroidales bacterium]|nr:excinuclease ABC subunit A [Bacteroidales bacterium]